jgi:hypothetical protein
MVIKIPKKKVNCDSCGGSGLYQGMGEGGKSAVICQTCSGKGWVYPSSLGKKYKLFTKRVIKKNIERVFDTGGGYGITHEDYTSEDGRTVHFSQYGASYKDWLEGKVPVPIKELYCPYIWDNRGCGNEPLERCRNKSRERMRISSCMCFNFKEKCWEDYEKKFKPKYLISGVKK